MIIRPTTLLLIIFFTGCFCYSLSRIDSLLGKLDPQKFAASIQKKTKKLEDKLVAKSMKVLEKLQRQEKKIIANFQRFIQQPVKKMIIIARSSPLRLNEKLKKSARLFSILFPKSIGRNFLLGSHNFFKNL